jgi:hypothetical protein
VYIDKKRNNLVVKDDGDGMTANDFQNKFLKIGYSKRKGGKIRSAGKNRPYIGRKGIGKLALLSCSAKVAVISKTKGWRYIGGVIDNAGLDEAIKKDVSAPKYPLGKVKLADFASYTKRHKKGTIVYFENMNDGIKSSLANIRKMLALYFKFSLIDKSFRIHVDGKPITYNDLNNLAKRTEFVWVINDLEDPYLTRKLRFKKSNMDADVNLLEPPRPLKFDGGVKGFIATVRKPADLKIFTTDERVGVDLFVNGRLRVRDILRLIPTAKVPENYLYGQIHFDELDDEKDRFSTSREEIVADDEKFTRFLEAMRPLVLRVIAEWDPLRIEHHEEGDQENTTISKKERKAGELYDAVSDEYKTRGPKAKSEQEIKVNRWVDALANDAQYNFASYADCFVSENLIRKHIEEEKLSLTPEAQEEIEKQKTSEELNKNKGNISIELRKTPTDTSYLSMDYLANMVDKTKSPARESALSRDATEYKPIRNALMHTALLTDEAKNKLSTVLKNVTARVKTLLAD